MSDDIESLVLDLVEWVAREPRSYAEVFDTWRTSCPRLPVWEEPVTVAWWRDAAARMGQR